MALFETGLAKVVIFKSQQSLVILNLEMDVDAGYKHVEKFSGGNPWYIVESKVFFSNVSFEL